METLETAIVASPSAHPLPPLSCDTHCHVFGPFDTFPIHHLPTYALPDAPSTHYLGMLDTVGMERGILVQPAPYGTDPSLIIQTITQRPASLRGIAVAQEDVSAATLETWKSKGIEGLRFIEARDPAGHLFPGSVGFDSLHKLAPNIRAAGMHAQLWGPYAAYENRLFDLCQLGIDICIDHMGNIDVSKGLNDPHFQLLLRLLDQGNVWLKLTVCRVSKTPGAYEDVRPYHDALVATNPDRLLWGSDWPYVRMGALAPNPGQLIDVAYDWLGNDTLRKNVWVDNPARLYNF